MYVHYTIEVEDSYDGPKLEDDISAEFMKDLLKWFKEEKKLHKKYCYKVLDYVFVYTVCVCVCVCMCVRTHILMCVCESMHICTYCVYTCTCRLGNNMILS